MFKKLSLGSYRWISYNEAHDISSNFGKGLRVLGEQPQTPIAIYAETRAEWIMSAFGAFSQSIVVSTLYTNLGDEAIIHGLNETEVRNNIFFPEIDDIPLKLCFYTTKT